MFFYLPWHFFSIPWFFLQVIDSFSWHFWRFFSIQALIKTLFTPWKRLNIRKQTPGFNLSQWFQELTYNLISRVIGFIVRLSTIFIGLVFIMLTWSFGLVGILVWFFLPFVTLPIFLLTKKNQPYLVRVEKYIQKMDSVLEIWNYLIKTRFGQYFFARLEIDQNSYLKINEIIKSFSSSLNAKLFQDRNQIKTIDQFVLFLYFNCDSLREFLSQLFITQEDLVETILFFQDNERNRHFRRQFWQKSNLSHLKPIGQDWAFGYTPILDQFSTEINEQAKFKRIIVGRNKEIEMLEKKLLGDKGYLLLIGADGIGKKTIVEGLAQKISLGFSAPNLNYKRILFFDLNALIAQKDTPEERRTLLDQAVAEADAAGNVILVINQFERFVTDRTGYINLTPTFSKIAQTSKTKIIGITTTENYQRFIATNSTISTIFDEIAVSPILAPQAEKIINVLFAEKKESKIFSHFAIAEIVNRSDLLITDIPFPEKAIELAEEIYNFYPTAKFGLTVITKQQVAEFLSQKLNIPLTSVSSSEKQQLLHLEDAIHQRLIGQNQAIQKIVSAIQRARLEIASQNRPIASFLFLGPTGVGKTETAKTLAAVYFGDEKNFIRFDMSEYQDLAKLEDFLGSSKTETFGILIDKVKEKPFSILLLDEIEKANRQILNVFLTILDEGYLTDYKGNRISFQHQIIIATSNAGAPLINQLTKEGVASAEIEKQLGDHLISSGIFSPEFLNRFDALVYYQPLTRQELALVTKLQLDKLNKDLKKKYHLQFKITDQLINQIMEEGYSPEYGARPIKRIITEKVGSQVARAILEGKAKAGDQIEINFL